MLGPMSETLSHHHTSPWFFRPVANVCFQALFCRLQRAWEELPMQTARPVGGVGLSSLAICPHLHVAVGKVVLMTSP